MFDISEAISIFVIVPNLGILVISSRALIRGLSVMWLLPLKISFQPIRLDFRRCHAPFSQGGIRVRGSHCIMRPGSEASNHPNSIRKGATKFTGFWFD